MNFLASLKLRLCVLGFLTTLLVSALFLESHFFQSFEYAFSDLRTRISQSSGISSAREQRIILIDVDERSLAELGSWPWPRDRVARLIQQLIETYQVEVVALDMVFPNDRPSSARLSKALLDTHTYHGYVYGDAVSSNEHPVLPSDWQIAREFPITYRQSFIATSPIGDRQTGHIHPSFDQDGVVRTIPSLICASDTCHWPLALTIWAGLLGETNITVQPGQWVPWELNVGASKIALDKRGHMLVPYRHARQSWLAISAADILNQSASRAVLKGTIVVIGSTALGLSDVVATPLDPVASGMEVHAELLAGLLDEAIPKPFKHSLGLYAIFFFVSWSCLLLTVGPSKNPTLRLIWSLGLLVSFFVIAGVTWFLLYVQAQVILPIMPLIIFLVLGLIFMIGMQWQESKELQMVTRRILAKYIPGVIAEELIEGSTRESEQVEAQDQRVTVLFADILGYTRFAEGRSPEVLAEFTQHIFKIFAQVIERHNGTIDKYMGDSVLAFWPSREGLEDSSGQMALAAAQDLLQTIEGIAPWARRLGFEHLRLGIGLETGYAMVGHFGSAARRTYTVIGEPVVMATRLEALTRRKELSLMIGPGFADAWPDLPLQVLGDEQLTGFQQRHTVYIPKN